MQHVNCTHFDLCVCGHTRQKNYQHGKHCQTWDCECLRFVLLTEENKYEGLCRN